MDKRVKKLKVTKDKKMKMVQIFVTKLGSIASYCTRSKFRQDYAQVPYIKKLNKMILILFLGFINFECGILKAFRKITLIFFLRFVNFECGILIV